MNDTAAIWVGSFCLVIPIIQLVVILWLVVKLWGFPIDVNWRGWSRRDDD